MHNPENVTRDAVHFNKYLVQHLVFSNTDTKAIYMEKKRFFLIRDLDEHPEHFLNILKRRIYLKWSFIQNGLKPLDTVLFEWLYSLQHWQEAPRRTETIIPSYYLISFPIRSER